MKYAIFSDIQGNYKALRRFFDEVNQTVDRYLCLGDIVQNGSSFEDNLCIDLVKKHGCLAVRGNHEDRVLANRETSRKKISLENLEFISSLPSELIVDKKFFLVHAPSGKRIVSSKQAEEEFIKMPQEITFYLYGHSHKPMLFSKDESKIKQESIAYHNQNYLSPTSQYMINPGGVGLYFGLPQTYMIFDDDSRELYFIRLS